MNATILRLSGALLSLYCLGACAGPGELVMIAPRNHAMPFAQFSNGELTAGILKDMGEALAQRLQLKARFIAVPSRRVGIVLAGGKADGVCLVRPGWIDGEFNWSPDMIPTGGAVLARRGAAPLMGLADLRGMKIGTIAGYRYKVVGDALGKEFVRDDGPSVEHTLRKLVAGRTPYALMESNTAAWHVKKDRSGSLRLDYIYERSMAQCAFSQRSGVPYEQVQRANAAMILDHTVERIMARYR